MKSRRSMMKPTCIHSSELWVLPSFCSTWSWMAWRTLPRLLSSWMVPPFSAASTRPLSALCCPSIVLSLKSGS